MAKISARRCFEVARAEKVTGDGRKIVRVLRSDGRVLRRHPGTGHYSILTWRCSETPVRYVCVGAFKAAYENAGLRVTVSRPNVGTLPVRRFGATAVELDHISDCFARQRV